MDTECGALVFKINDHALLRLTVATIGVYQCNNSDREREVAGDGIGFNVVRSRRCARRAVPLWIEPYGAKFETSGSVENKTIRFQKFIH